MTKEDLAIFVWLRGLTKITVGFCPYWNLKRKQIKVWLANMVDGRQCMIEFLTNPVPVAVPSRIRNKKSTVNVTCVTVEVCA